MKLSKILIFCSLILGVSSQRRLSFIKEAGQASRHENHWALGCFVRCRHLAAHTPRTTDMVRAYWNMRNANYKDSDKYFHTRGNYDAAQRGPGGVWAAEVISDFREAYPRLTDHFKHGDSGHGLADSMADQEANRWGRSGKDPNFFRPRGLPDKY